MKCRKSRPTDIYTYKYMMSLHQENMHKSNDQQALCHICSCRSEQTCTYYHINLQCECHVHESTRRKIPFKEMSDTSRTMPTLATRAQSTSHRTEHIKTRIPHRASVHEAAEQTSGISTLHVRAKEGHQRASTLSGTVTARLRYALEKEYPKWKNPPNAAQAKAYTPTRYKSASRQSPERERAGQEST